MPYLKKISLQNVRRFGSNVELDLVQGTNIILAPNGTGKTSIFEAIEFALSNSVLRLDNRMNSLIRDGQEELMTRLSFDNGWVCQGQYVKGQKPVVSGNHKELFPNHDLEEIPFLLRLTHLLEQHGQNWIVRSDSEEAGSLLSHLPISKDLVMINNSKTATTREVNRRISDLKHSVGESKKVYDEFIELRREHERTQEITGLKSVEELNEDLKSIGLELEAKVKTEYGEGPIQLISVNKQIQVLVSQRLLRISEDIKLYSVIDQKLKEYFDSQTKITELEKVMSEVTQKQLTEELITKDLNVQLNERIEKIANNRMEVQSYEEHLKKDLFQKSLTEKIIKKKDQEKIFKSELSKINKELPRVNDDLIRVKKLQETQLNIKKEESSIIDRQNQLLKLQSSLQDWVNSEKQLHELASQLAQYGKIQSELEVKASEVIDLLNSRKKEYLKSEGQLKALSDVSDSILEAVGIISSSLPEDEENCPVCLANYEPSDLRKRIGRAIESINPLLKEEQEHNSRLRRNVSETTNELNQINLELNEVNSNLMKTSEEIENQKSIIKNRFHNKYGISKSSKEAAIWLSGETKKLESERTALDKKKANEDVEPVDDTLAEKESTYSKLKENAVTLESELSILEGSIKEDELDLTESYKFLEEDEIAQLKERRDALKNKIQDLEREVEETKSAYEIAKAIVKEKQREADLLSDRINRLKRLIAEFLAEWNQTNIEGEPSIKKLDKAKGELLDRKERLATLKHELDLIESELQSWVHVEKNSELEKRLLSQCGDLSPEEYELSLLKKFNKEERKLLSANIKKEALMGLFRRASIETQKINQYLEAINPTWSSLLKKVVLNPLFEGTLLKSYSKYNKQQASIDVDLHNERVKVSDVASEAQITDLQLTFLLSMAKKYSWTPWKALLLDDPTQHHDLVHASSVFDLLRDYCINGKFQVLFGTHDQIQASFLERKMQNEGIPVRTWRLIGEEEGIAARCIE